MSDEVMAPEAPAVVEAGLGDADVSLDTATYASEGLHDSPPTTSASEVVDNSTEKVAPKTTYTEEDVSRIREGERLRVQIENQRQEMQASIQKQQREEQEAKQRQAVLDRELYQRAQSGDVEAQNEIYTRGVTELEERTKREQMSELLEPGKSEARQETRRQVWEQFAGAFGMSPDDPGLLSVPGNLGFKGITAEVLKRTSEADLLEAIKQNPAVRKWLKEEVDTGSQAAQARGMARALGSGDAPRADVGGSSGRGLTGDALEKALMSNPDDTGLYKAWVEQEKSANRYW